MYTYSLQIHNISLQKSSNSGKLCVGLILLSYYNSNICNQMMKHYSSLPAWFIAVCIWYVYRFIHRFTQKTEVCILIKNLLKKYRPSYYYYNWYINKADCKPSAKNIQIACIFISYVTNFTQHNNKCFWHIKCCS